MESECKFISSFYSVLASIAIYFIFYFFNRQRKLSVFNKFPGPKTIPILGNALDLLVEPTEFFRIYSTEFCKYPGGIARVWIGFVPYCFIYSADKVEVLLSSQKYLNKSVDYQGLHPWLGTGLLTSTGSKWQHRRKMLTPAFHFKILEDFVEVFNQQSNKLVKNLESRINGKPFNIFHYITLCTLDIILETAMGRGINAQDNENSDYVRAIYGIGRIVMERTTRPWLQIKPIFELMGYGKKQREYLNILHGFAYETIRERRRERDNNKKGKKEESEEVLGKRKRFAFLDLLLEFSEQNDYMSDEDIREEVDTFMFEGHDTTAASLNWTLYLLGRHPEIQNKVYEELELIYGKSDRDSTSSDLREMKYLECCIKESLRLFPSVPLFGRELNEEMKIDGHSIPKGTNIMVVTYRLHRDPTQFPDPEVFNPDRFLMENAVKRNPYAYIPFSAGPRNCIGQKFALMEEKIVLSTFLRKYRVESTVKREDLKLMGDMILRPEKDTLIKIFPRN